jgi:hypothetical protein
MGFRACLDEVPKKKKNPVTGDRLIPWSIVLLEKLIVT